MQTDYSYKQGLRSDLKVIGILINAIVAWI